MRRRHAAPVVLLGGWLLMTPPPNVDDPQARYGPESYSQTAVFDSASACEAQRRQRAADLLGRMKKHPPADGGIAPQEVANFAAGKCLPAEVVHPRSKSPTPSSQHRCRRR
jgi:hypothetical protein